MEKTVATLLRKISLTETSLIVHWSSAEIGLFKTVAKGARRPKSAFAGKLDLFYHCELEFVRSRRSELHTLREVAVLRNRLGLRSSYTTTLAASYFVKLLEKVAETDSPMPELTDLLERALNYLETTQPNRRAVIHFENQLAELLGINRPDRAAFVNIAEVYGNLPPQREDLLNRIAQSTA